MRSLLPDSKPRFTAVSAAAAALISLSVLVTAFLYSYGDRILLCSLHSPAVTRSTTTAESLLTSAILHYATSSVTPQQSRSEISASYRVLRTRSPCNFLVFGLGHDSLMWHSFNLAPGSTVFLEEDRKWFQSVLKDNPALSAFNVRYRTRLIEADDLFRSWREEKGCLPAENKGRLQGNVGCRLALAELPDVVYQKEWDVIMIDAPKGYFNEAPGRMGAIYSAAVMARNRKGAGPTDVFLHDVDRKVEKMYAMEFLCKKNLVEAVGRLWHFRIPAVKGNESSSSVGFC